MFEREAVTEQATPKWTCTGCGILADLDDEQGVTRPVPCVCGAFKWERQVGIARQRVGHFFEGKVLVKPLGSW